MYLQSGFKGFVYDYTLRSIHGNCEKRNFVKSVTLILLEYNCVWFRSVTAKWVDPTEL